jgi:hypothetical protein
MNMPSPQEAIEYVIAAQGNTKLAAGRLNRDTKLKDPNSPEITEARLLTIITQDPNSLNTLTTQIRLLTIMQATDAFRLTHAAFLANLPELSPPAIARTYLALLTTMTQLADLSITPTDPYDAIMRSLPPEVSSAVQKLLSPPTPTSPAASPNSTNITLPTIIPAPPKEGVTTEIRGQRSDTNTDD